MNKICLCSNFGAKKEQNRGFGQAEKPIFQVVWAGEFRCRIIKPLPDLVEIV